jgi:hypothetical protein
MSVVTTAARISSAAKDRLSVKPKVLMASAMWATPVTALARAFGCYAERVSAPAKVRPALERAFAAGTPAVIEVMVEREYPLSGSPAAGWWDVPVPTYPGGAAGAVRERAGGGALTSNPTLADCERRARTR